MQKCKNCGQRFQWKQFFISLMLAYRPVECRNCGMLHKVTGGTRVTAAVLLFIPVVIANLYLIGQDVSVFLLALLLIFVVESLLLPFLMKVEPGLAENE